MALAYFRIHNKPAFILALLLTLVFVWFFGFRQALLWLIGLGFGILLNGARFGFTTGWRRYIQAADTSGINAQLLLLTVLSVLSLIAFEALPHLQTATAPVTISMIFGAFCFGALMQMADGCGSGTLYKAGNLQVFNLLILVFFIAGAFGGTLHIDWWLGLGTVWSATNLLQLYPWWQYLGVQLALIAVVFVMAHSLCYWRLGRHKQTLVSNLPSWTPASVLLVAAVALAIFSVFNLLVAGQPWGIVYGLGLWGAKLAQGFGMPLENYVYWQAPYNQLALARSSLFDNTSMTNLGILYGSFCLHQPVAKLASENDSFSLKRLAKIATIGFLLGYTSRLAFGCNIGAFVSGISTGSIHGWVWFICAFAGSYALIKFNTRSQA